MDEQLEQLIIQKADMLAAELKAAGGHVSPDKSKRFIRKVVERPTLLNLISTETMSSDTLVLNKIEMADQFLHAAAANARLPENKRSKVNATQEEFPSCEVQGEILLPYASLEDNLEGEDLIQTVLDLAAEKTAISLERLLINGDTASNDPFLALQDGILKRLTSHVVDLDGTPLNASTCQAILLALPKQYRRDRGILRWMLTPDDQERLIGRIAARQTAYGDALLTGEAQLKLSKIVSEQAGYLPDGTAILGNPKNIVMGIRRKVTLESERLISERMVKFVLTARIAIGIRDENSMVKAIDIGADDEA